MRLAWSNRPRPPDHHGHLLRVAVIGAGTVGLAAAQALSARGLDVVIHEAGSQLGGNWRWDNDSGFSSGYRSLQPSASASGSQATTVGVHVARSGGLQCLEQYAASRFGLLADCTYPVALEPGTYPVELQRLDRNQQGTYHKRWRSQPGDDASRSQHREGHQMTRRRGGPDGISAALEPATSCTVQCARTRRGCCSQRRSTTCWSRTRVNLPPAFAAGTGLHRQRGAWPRQSDWLSYYL